MKDEKRKAVVLLSGGIDSTTAMAIAKHEGRGIYSLSFRYGQRHGIELEAARKVAEVLRARKHLVIDIDPAVMGGSALTDNIEVPKARTEAEMGGDPGHLRAGTEYDLSFLCPCLGRSAGGIRDFCGSQCR